MTKAVSEQELKQTAVAPRVTQDAIEALLKRVKYAVVQQPEGTTSTFVHAYLDGKFLLGTGFSACVDPANFNADIGLRIATADAQAKATSALWGFEGYYLYKEHYAPTTYLERLQREYNENSSRLVKLQEFLFKGKPDTFSQDAWDDLVSQEAPQADYVNVLKRRSDKTQ